jgi:hypothetical protein
MTDAPFADLDRFVAYADAQFQLRLLAGCFATDRAQPDVPDRAAGLSLLLGEVIHVPSLNQLQQETKLPQWQRWVGYLNPISHDTFGFTANRMNPERLRRGLRWTQAQAGQGLGGEQGPRPVGGEPGRQRTILQRSPLL